MGIGGNFGETNDGGSTLDGMHCPPNFADFFCAQRLPGLLQSISVLKFQVIGAILGSARRLPQEILPEAIAAPHH